MEITTMEIIIMGIIIMEIIIMEIVDILTIGIMGIIIGMVHITTIMDVTTIIPIMGITVTTTMIGERTHRLTISTIHQGTYVKHNLQKTKWVDCVQ